jgi:hypothetical protein
MRFKRRDVTARPAGDNQSIHGCDIEASLARHVKSLCLTTTGNFPSIKMDLPQAALQEGTGVQGPEPPLMRSRFRSQRRSKRCWQAIARLLRRPLRSQASGPGAKTKSLRDGKPYALAAKLF